MTKGIEILYDEADGNKIPKGKEEDSQDDTVIVVDYDGDTIIKINEPFGDDDNPKPITKGKEVLYDEADGKKLTQPSTKYAGESSRPDVVVLSDSDTEVGDTFLLCGLFSFSSVFVMIAIFFSFVAGTK
ncbi:hypothetical protein RJT34_23764 [Clitoria ternatea]|uniref:Uncharacterized protein n=1 Tax=Clitoria ternatea TaxID=43366 RepID=A0AAN9FTA6_CLITE